MAAKGGGGGGAKSPAWYSSKEEIDAALERVRKTFDSGVTRDIEWRKRQLRAVRRMLSENEADIVAALAEDIGRPRSEALAGDYAGPVCECDEMLAHLEEWTAPEVVATPLAHMLAHSEIRSEPYGVVLVIAPWNYPVQLLVNPLVAALAAGNAAVLKPSEHAPACAQLLTRLVGEYLDPNAVQVVNGAAGEATHVLSKRWDYIFFTGGDVVGKIVAKAAAEHLTPVTLELGGKSPVIVTRSANLSSAARRIIQGRCFNAGQSCVACDYVLVDRSVSDELSRRLVDAVREFYGDEPKASASFGRLVHRRHTERALAMLQEEHGGAVLCGGAEQVDLAECYCPPTIIRSPRPSSTLMREEIFSPILPVIPFDSLDEAVDRVREGAKPLALYVFTTDAREREKVLAIPCGGAMVNDTLLHFSNSELPFGGIGSSGIGAYHGKHGFDLFSHKRAVEVARSWSDPLYSVGRYPPYPESRLVESLVWLMFIKPPRLGSFGKTALLLAAFAAVAYLGYRAGRDNWIQQPRG